MADFKSFDNINEISYFIVKAIRTIIVRTNDVRLNEIQNP
jgi:hypothetical protein